MKVLRLGGTVMGRQMKRSRWGLLRLRRWRVEKEKVMDGGEVCEAESIEGRKFLNSERVETA
jgi:hypothetical protein